MSKQTENTAHAEDIDTEKQTDMLRHFWYLLVLGFAIAVLLIKYERRGKASGKNSADRDLEESWSCPRCGEPVPESFDKCWNCGSQKG